MVLASCLVAWGVISNNTLVLFVILTVFFLLQYLAILKIDYKPEKKSSVFKASMKYLIHSKSKYKIIYALASLNKFQQFTTMNVIDGQAGLISYTSLIF